jgi:hypothetical protein
MIAEEFFRGGKSVNARTGTMQRKFLNFNIKSPGLALGT